MKKILFAQRNHMNVWLLTLITLVFLTAAGFSFLNYAFGMTGLGLDLFTAFTNGGMTTLLGAFVFGILAVLSLWASWNRFYAPVWLIAVFGICYVLVNYWMLSEVPKSAIFIAIVCILTIVYYLWCQRKSASNR